MSNNVFGRMLDLKPNLDRLDRLDNVFHSIGKNKFPYRVKTPSSLDNLSRIKETRIGKVLSNPLCSSPLNIHGEEAGVG